jgi:hypothetical protein
MDLNDPALRETIKNYNKQGRRVFIKMPEGALPIFAGKDTVEFTKSVKGKRAARRLMKNNS